MVDPNPSTALVSVLHAIRINVYVREAAHARAQPPLQHGILEVRMVEPQTCMLLATGRGKWRMKIPGVTLLPCFYSQGGGHGTERQLPNLQFPFHMPIKKVCRLAGPSASTSKRSATFFNGMHKFFPTKVHWGEFPAHQRHDIFLWL